VRDLGPRNLLQKETAVYSFDKLMDEYSHSMDFELTPYTDSGHSDSVNCIGEISMRDHPVSAVRIVNFINHEPMKRTVVAHSAPPKRFYRTFWRGLTRRAVQHYSNDNLDLQ
jgi:hypothetical protein